MPPDLEPLPESGCVQYYAQRQPRYQYHSACLTSGWCSLLSMQSVLAACRDQLHPGGAQAEKVGLVLACAHGVHIGYLCLVCCNVQHDHIAAFVYT